MCQYGVLSADPVLADVMVRPKVRRFLPPTRGQGFVTLLRDLALFVSPASEFPPAETPAVTSWWPPPGLPVPVTW